MTEKHEQPHNKGALVAPPYEGLASKPNPQLTAGTPGSEDPGKDVAEPVVEKAKDPQLASRSTSQVHKLKRVRRRAAERQKEYAALQQRLLSLEGDQVALKATASSSSSSVADTKSDGLRE